ncbi:MAG: type II toxin-antitoxin system mRNA interferase toxin, RelE/StbE family [Candidatus Gracilibacteria bacterium]|jgi:addiction module RelE/StbE family toxin
MKISSIHYSDAFKAQFDKLQKEIQIKAVKTINLFRENPFYPSIRLHKLKGKLYGLWSISLDLRYRIIFKITDDGVVLLVSIGTHAIYDE